MLRIVMTKVPRVFIRPSKEVKMYNGMALSVPPSVGPSVHLSGRPQLLVNAIS